MVWWIIIIVAVLTLIGRKAEGNNLFVRFCRPFGTIIGVSVSYFLGLFSSEKDKTIAGIIAGLVLVVLISTPIGKGCFTGFWQASSGLIAGRNERQEEGSKNSNLKLRSEFFDDTRILVLVFEGVSEASVMSFTLNGEVVEGLEKDPAANIFRWKAPIPKKTPKPAPFSVELLEA